MGYVLRVNKTDSVNTVGVLATSVWFGGCSFRCKGCYNPETWKLENGEQMTEEKLDKIIEDIPSGFNLSLLGGDPLEPQNQDSTIYLIQNFKARRPEAKVLIWTGRDYRLARSILGETFKSVDYIKVGPFIEEKFSRKLKYYGSENQKFLKLKKGEIVGIWSDEVGDFITEENQGG